MCDFIDKNDNYSERQIDEYLKIEYEQICNDWRHRDTMLWSVLSMVISVAAASVYILASEKLSLDSRMLIFALLTLFNIASLVKITKDHYYQQGSAELLKMIFPNLNKILNISDYSRIHKPSEITIKKSELGILVRPIYSLLTKRISISLLTKRISIIKPTSTYRVFYTILLLLNIITIVFWLLEIMESRYVFKYRFIW